MHDHDRHLVALTQDRAFERPLVKDSIAEDVLRGLSHSPKVLPPRLFYDEKGSELFETITTLPEYYLMRTELEILTDSLPDIIDRAGTPRVVIELGAGTAAKTRVLLAAILVKRPQLVYHPIDVSEGALAVAARTVTHARLSVRPYVGRYEDILPRLVDLRGPKLVLFLGSSIGNYETVEATRLLAQVRAVLAPGDAMILGTDLFRKFYPVGAYDDVRGVTADFNKNVLVRINRELRGEFDVNTFRHVAIWNEGASRIEMHLESSVRQRVYIGGLGRYFNFEVGERIHTESSYKRSEAAQHALLEEAGFEPEATWKDTEQRYAVHLARVGR